MANELVGFETEEQVRQAIKRYNQWQAVEYNAISARARTARQFLMYQTNRNVYPNLTWVRSRSANPREAHLVLVGLTLPIDHSYWQTNQPGNLYGCKCDWKQTRATPSEHVPSGVPPSPGLEGNPLQSGELITRRAGHFKRQENKVVNPAIVEKLGDLQWMSFKTPKGPDINAHILHGTQELKKNMEVFNDLLNIQSGVAACRFLPVIHAGSKKLKEGFYPKGQAPKDPKKNADAVIELQNGQKWVVDFKITGSPHLQRVLTGSAMQAKYAVIKFEHGLTIGLDRIKAEVDLKIKNGQLFGVFVLNHKGELIYSRLKNTTAEKS